jgi:hypothetical protein
MGGDKADDARCSLLAEYLTGEAGGEVDRGTARQVTRLVVAGNSMAQPIREAVDDSASKKTVSFLFRVPGVGLTRSSLMVNVTCYRDVTATTRPYSLTRLQKRLTLSSPPSSHPSTSTSYPEKKTQPAQHCPNSPFIEHSFPDRPRATD